MRLWKEYSWNYVKNNKATSISIMVAAFIASLLLSLICGVFYNIWVDDVELIKRKEGNWHSKLIGDISDQDIERIKSYPNIEEVLLENAEVGGAKTAILFFSHPRSIYHDMPKLAEQIGLNPEAGASDIQYHDKLLAQYFIFSPKEGNSPPPVLFIYLFTLLTSCLALILIIHNAFGVAMNGRLHQMGILQSIGATPRQIRLVLTNEGVLLSFLPIIAGVVTGAGLCFAFMKFVQSIVRSVRELPLAFHYSPLVALVSLAASFLTVLFCVILPARKLSRINPLDAIRYGGEPPVKKVKRYLLVSRLLGIEGELARKALYSRRKAYRTSALSLTISFLVFSSFLNFETISGISTKRTLFERYEDVWDLIVCVNNIENNQNELLSNIRNIPGVENCISYQKATAFTKLSREVLSDELLSLGGLEGLKDTNVQKMSEYYLVEVPLLALDEDSFREYCTDANIEESLFTTGTQTGTIALNTIWDNTTSNRRNRKMIPFIKADQYKDFKLWKDIRDISQEQSTILTNIIATSDHFPKIKEDFPNFSLLQIMPESTYQIIDTDYKSNDCFFTILAESEECITDINNRLLKLLDHQYEYTLKNRLESQMSDAIFRNAYKLVIGGLAGLLACIGLANVFSNTLGHLHQRKREFARLITVGLSPRGLIKVLIMEALVVGLKPILFSLLVNIPLIVLALNISLIYPAEFLQQMPIIPIALFAGVIMACVGFAYLIGGRIIYKSDMIEALKNETLI